jgi:hypothetical protein
MISIESLGELITKEIRLNRAIRSQFQSLFQKNQRKIVLLDYSEWNNFRKAQFLEDVLEEFQEVRKKVEKGEKVCLGMISALLKQVEVEEKYLIDEFLKVRSFCFLSFAALEFRSREERVRIQKAKGRREMVLVVLVVFMVFFFLV